LQIRGARTGSPRIDTVGGSRDRLVHQSFQSPQPLLGVKIVDGRVDVRNDWRAVSGDDLAQRCG